MHTHTHTHGQTQMATPTPENIHEYIKNGLPCQMINVTGDGHHFEALIISELFVGKSQIERHKLVYKALGERMRQEIHALSMKTLTPEEFAQR